MKQIQKKVLFISKIYGERFNNEKIKRICELDITDYCIIEEDISYEKQFKEASILGIKNLISFDDFKKLNIDWTIYDMVVNDTVHYTEITQYILKELMKKFRIGIYFILHDCAPNKNLLKWSFPRRNRNVEWIGTTWKDFYNFHINNPEISKILSDGGLGAGIIKTNGKMITEYDNVEADFDDLHRRTIKFKDFIPLFSQKMDPKLETKPFILRSINVLFYIEENPLLFSSTCTKEQSLVETKNYIFNLLNKFFSGCGLSYTPDKQTLKRNTLIIDILTPVGTEMFNINFSMFLSCIHLRIKKAYKDRFGNIKTISCFGRLNSIWIEINVEEDKYYDDIAIGHIIPSCLPKEKYGKIINI